DSAIAVGTESTSVYQDTRGPRLSSSGQPFSPPRWTSHRASPCSRASRTMKARTCGSSRGAASSSRVSERVGIELAGADAHHAVQVPDEDLAVADLAGARRLHDRLDHGVELLVGDRDLELDLGQEVDHVLGAAVELGVALLATEALDLGGGDAGHAGLRQRLAHIVELERLDHRHDHLHRAASGAS